MMRSGRNQSNTFGPMIDLTFPINPRLELLESRTLGLFCGPELRGLSRRLGRLSGSSWSSATVDSEGGRCGEAVIVLAQRSSGGCLLNLDNVLFRKTLDDDGLEDS